MADVLPAAQVIPSNQEDKKQKAPLKTEWKQRFNETIREAKSLEKSGEFLLSLWKYSEASDIAKKSKITVKMGKLRKICTELELQHTGDAFKQIDDSWHYNIVTDCYTIHSDNHSEYILPAATYLKLYDYQRAALVWFWSVYQSPNGGILGDDMGLGKTVQMSAYLHGAFHSKIARCVLLIVPVSMISHWTKELESWCPLPSGYRIKKYHSSISEKRRQENLEYIARRGGVLITSYGMVQKNYASMDIQPMSGLMRFGEVIRHGQPWDYMILDEGHMIKNQGIGVSQAVRHIPVQRSNRILLSGTFLQNELSELWSLFDFISEGSLFGTHAEFNETYAAKISLGRQKNAPYLLRRTKQGIRAKQSRNQREEDDEKSRGDDGTSNGHGNGEREKEKSLTPMLKAEKRELVVWITMTTIQTNIYRSFLESDAVKEALNTTKSPLAALTVLKKICNNPFLLSDEDGKYRDRRVENTLATASKMGVLLQILKELIGRKHRVLVFSQYKAILSMVEPILRENKMEFIQMDGDTKIEDRQKMVDQFNADKALNVFLLSTKVGGLGLNLTGSDRVIIYDPAWNPATDAQAVDRSYRIGQVNDVMVYRMVTCGTIEERIYRRQISKVGLLKSVTGNSNQQRYFSKSELKDVFTLEDPTKSQTQIQFKHLREHRVGTNADFDRETDHVEGVPNVFGVSDHDLLFGTCRAEELEENKDLMDQIEAARGGLSAPDSKSQSRLCSMNIDSDDGDGDEDEDDDVSPSTRRPRKRLKRADVDSDSDEEWVPE